MSSAGLVAAVCVCAWICWLVGVFVCVCFFKQRVVKGLGGGVLQGP